MDECFASELKSSDVATLGVVAHRESAKGAALSVPETLASRNEIEGIGQLKSALGGWAF
jgi:hypothetical protein